MDILLEREVFTTNSTIGSLYFQTGETDSEVDYEFQCYILEDTCREEFGKPETFHKVPKQTAIPYGKYKVIRSLSNHFQRVMPEILNVPYYEGIRIHSGNDAADTDGCLITGSSRKKDWVSQSKDAYDKLDKAIETALSNGEEVWLEIVKGEEVTL